MDTRITFRASAPLAEALAQRAKLTGSSVSDYIRTILGEHVVLVSSDAPPPISITVTPARSVHELAAQGSPDAYRELAGWHYERGLSGAEPQVIAYARATVYSRLALLSRGERQDWLNHLFLLDAHGGALANAGFGTLANQAIAETVALAETMANEGDDEMANLVVGSAGAVAPEAMTLARDLLDSAKETAKC